MSDLHTATVIADADLADAVELPARLSGTAGLLRITLAKIKLYLSTALVLVPVGGAAGDVLTKASVTDNDVHWAAPSGGGGSLVLLEQHAAASSASLDFAASISATYDEYLIEFVNVVPATNAVNLFMRMSTNGGTSYDAGANYSYVAIGSNRFGIGETGVDSGGAQIQLNKSAIDNTATNGVCGSIRLFSPGSTTLHKNVSAQLNILTSGTLETEQSSGWYRSATPVNAFRFLFSAGNIASGTIRVYGVAK